MTLTVLDLFSAAAGGWSLGMHRAGFETVAACEAVDWRRALFAQNNPGVKIYDDVRTLSAERLVRDLAWLPDVIVGSPPCQDISSANTKGKGVDGERSGLYFEAIRIIGECRPCWFALENSANLRTRGADRVIAALEALGYTVWAFVVGGDNVGANHERKRSWLIRVDLKQLADASKVGCAPWTGDHQGEYARHDGRVFGDHADHGNAADSDGVGRYEGRRGRRSGIDLSVSQDPLDTTRLGHEGGRTWGHGPHGNGSSSVTGGAGDIANTDEARQPHGPLVASLRQAEVAHDGCRAGRSTDGQGTGQVGLCASDRISAFQHRADWSLDDLARHIRLDDGLPARVAGSRIAVGGPGGVSAASLIVEAFGDAVIPQITEAIGRSILRTDRALRAIYGRTTPALSSNQRSPSQPNTGDQS